MRALLYSNVISEMAKGGCDQFLEHFNQPIHWGHHIGFGSLAGYIGKCFHRGGEEFWYSWAILFYLESTANKNKWENHLLNYEFVPSSCRLNMTVQVKFHCTGFWQEQKRMNNERSFFTWFLLPDHRWNCFAHVSSSIQLWEVHLFCIILPLSRKWDIPTTHNWSGLWKKKNKKESISSHSTTRLVISAAAGQIKRIRPLRWLPYFHL